MVNHSHIQTPAEIRSAIGPAEIQPRTQHEAELLARLQTARMLASTVDAKSRDVIGNHLGMRPSQVEREIAFYEDVKAGRQVPEISPDQLRAIVGGGA